MANISLYVSGQTELNDVAEFFQKRLIKEGENPIAFFDGVFYESHQERVGNIVYQDYLVYTDKAVYLWARGTAKDYLDRFTLGSVSVNSRNKDSAFATLNLKIKRDAKEPVYVIFDMVEIREADAIVKLHTVIESTIEDYLGVNYRQEIPQEISMRILQSGRGICQPRSIAVSPEEPRMPVADPGIGYGQDLLEQYKAAAGYGPQQAPGYPGAAPQASYGPGMGAPEVPRGLEGMLPTDPASIKRIAGQLKDMVGDAPFKLREQVMKDLQHVPNDVATVLTAVNELLSSIAGNPQAERFVMNAIKTAVANDGLIGSVGKIIKLTGLGGGRKSSRPAASQQEPAARQARPARQDDADDDGTIRRRKISVRDDESAGGFDMFRDEEPEAPSPKAASRPVAEQDDDTPRRRKLAIRMEGGDDDIARKLMDYDESQRDQPEATAGPASVPPVDAETDAEPRRKKLSVRTEGDGDDIARKLMDYDESQRDQPATAEEIPAPAESHEEPVAPLRKKLAVKAAEEVDDIAGRLMGYDESARDDAPAAEPVSGPEPAIVPEPAAVPPSRKKISIKAGTAEEASLPVTEEELVSTAPAGKPASAGDYLMLESDLPITKPSPAPAGGNGANAADAAPGSPIRDGGSGKPSDSHSLTA